MEQQKKLPEREQDNRDKLTLRLSPDLNLYTKKKAESIGVTQNSLLVMLIDLGLKYYEGEIFTFIQAKN